MKIFPLDCLAVHLSWLEISSSTLRCRSGRHNFIWLVQGCLGGLGWGPNLKALPVRGSVSAHPRVCRNVLRGHQSKQVFFLNWSICQATLSFSFELKQPWHLPALCVEASCTKSYSHAGVPPQLVWLWVKCSPTVISIILTVNHRLSELKDRGSFFSTLARHQGTSLGGNVGVRFSALLQPGPSCIKCSSSTFLKHLWLTLSLVFRYRFLLYFFLMIINISCPD